MRAAAWQGSVCKFFAKKLPLCFSERRFRIEAEQLPTATEVKPGEKLLFKPRKCF